MKTLYIVRHAKSSWDNPLLSDFERPLNERGKRDAPRMAKRLIEQNITFDLWITSPAQRALTTALTMADVLAFPLENVHPDKRIYHASEETLLSIIRAIKNSYSTVMLFGHNPGLTDFINRLTNSSIDNIPTCGIVACQFNVNSWIEVGWRKGELLFFDYPKKDS